MLFNVFFLIKLTLIFINMKDVNFEGRTSASVLWRPLHFEWYDSEQVENVKCVHKLKRVQNESNAVSKQHNCIGIVIENKNILYYSLNP